MDEKKVRLVLALAVPAIVAYSIGYQKAQSRTIRDLGAATSKEAPYMQASAWHDQGCETH